MDFFIKYNLCKNERTLHVLLIYGVYFFQTPTTEAEWREVAMGFETKWQFPNCLGAIDGKHIYIQPPANSGSTYHNYKSRFSVVLMAVVDADYKFIYANVGVQGRVSDGGIFGQSDLRAAMDRHLLNVPPPEPLQGATYLHLMHLLVMKLSLSESI